ncbi:MAG: pentapeptide repeat-containing protein [Candidatus Omnitrophota bacterium]
MAELNYKDANLAHHNFHKANLKGAVFAHANLSHADLSDADLTDADLTGAILHGANLFRANLRGARLWHTDLSVSNLTEADLTGADFVEAKLHGVRFWRTDLENARFLGKKNFDSGKGFHRMRIDEKSPRAAEEGYRELKKYFLLHGKYDDASWASYREKCMEMRSLLKKKDPSFMPSFLMNILCGYGEIPHRVMWVALGLIFFYALLFRGFGSLHSSTSQVFTPSFGGYLYFSIVTFTTLGYGDFIPADSLSRLLAGSEAFLGIFTIGLFVFTLGRRYSAR